MSPLGSHYIDGKRHSPFVRAITALAEIIDDQQRIMESHTRKDTEETFNKNRMADDAALKDIEQRTKEK